MFSRCSSLIDLRIFKIDLDKVEDVNYMFSGCKKELKEKMKKLYKNLDVNAFIDEE